MFVVRETLHCQPGKVGALAKKFKGLSGIMKQMGMKPFRLMTDVAGQRFWTLIAELEVDSLEAMLQIEQKVMSNEEARALMSDYHELILEGRREIYRLEA